MERVEEEFQKQKKTKVDILKIFFIDLENRKDKYFHNVYEAYWRLSMKSLISSDNTSCPFNISIPLVFECSTSNLTTSLDPHLQAIINAVHP